MSLLSSRLLKRFAAGLASIIVLAGTVGVGYWAGLKARASRSISRANEPSAWKGLSSTRVDLSGNSSEQSSAVNTTKGLASGPEVTGQTGHSGALAASSATIPVRAPGRSEH